LRAGAIAGSAALALALVTGCGPKRLPDDTAARVALAIGSQGEGQRGTKGPTALSPATLSFEHAPTPFRGANGVACRDRQLLVAESRGDRVLRVTADGGFEPIALPSGIRGPDDLAIAPNGDLYVTASTSGEVWRQRASDGGWDAIARGLSGVSGIALDDGGRVFVGTCAPDGKLLELEPSGQRTPRVVAAGLACPEAMVADADGVLVVPLLEGGAVIRVGIADGTKAPLASGLRAPAAVKRAPDGTLVVLESGTGAIRALAGSADAAASEQEVARLAPGIGGFTTCGESAVASNFVTGEVTAFKPWPTSPRVLERGGLAEPRGLARTGEDVLVSDGVSIRRLRAGRADVLVASGIDPIPPPFALALGAAGVAWITVPELGEVHRVDLAARTSAKVAGGFDRPTSILALSEGGVVIADTGAGRIVRVEADGSTRTLASGLVNPLGLASRGGQILTTEPTGGRVLGIREGSPPALIATGLSAPAGLATDAAGHVFVAETKTSSLLRIDPDGSHRKVATGFAFGDAESDPRPIAMLAAPDGSLLIAIPGDGSVVRVVP
jgi:glucose/arabinose dehydrogenase